MPRYFRIEDAERLLPDVQAAIEGAIRLRKEHAISEEQIRRALQRIAMLGGSLVNRDAIMQERDRKDASAAAFEAAIEKIHSYGCQVKDLDVGLIDFPTRLRGREVLLCWKLGERGIEWWHGLDEGFAGRKRIDDDFLANHEGERPS